MTRSEDHWKRERNEEQELFGMRSENYRNQVRGLSEHAVIVLSILHSLEYPCRHSGGDADKSGLASP